MEADERPMKLRKLDHDKDSLLNEKIPAQSQSSSAAAEGSLTAPSHNSKPDEHTANVADSSIQHEVENGAWQNATESTTQHQEEQENGESTTKPMSKNQMKKMRKREEWEAARGDRKLKRKEKLQAKKARKKAAREEEELRLEEAKKSAVERGEDPDTVVAQLKKTQQAQHKPRRPVQLPVTIIIDCGFDDLMMEKERISLGSQITRSYSDNYRAPFQAHLVISSWGGLLKKRFDTVLSKHYLNWKNVVFEEGDFVTAAKNAAEVMRGPEGGKLAGHFEKSAKTPLAEKAEVEQSVESGDGALQKKESDADASTESTTQTEISANTSSSDRPVNSLPPKEGEVVYLTSDSPDTLSELSPYSTYIVGGLVDKNRHKGICYKIAKEKGIRTAKLPIGEYLDMQSRKVLATNHVVEIMVRWLECGDWGEAFMKVIPKRKGGKLRGESEQSSPDDDDDDDDDDDENKSAEKNDDDEVR